MRRAMKLKRTMVHIDEDKCDGCGLCVPACSEGAISQTKNCTIREEDNKKVLLLACEYINSSIRLDNCNTNLFYFYCRCL